MSRVGKNTVSKIFISKHGLIYRHVGYCEQPTVILDPVCTDTERLHLTLNSPNMDQMGFVQVDDLSSKELLKVIDVLSAKAQFSTLEGPS